MTQNKPDQKICDIVTTLIETRKKHDIIGQYQTQFRANAQDFEGLKRKWEEATGMSAPKNLKTSSEADHEVATFQTMIQRDEGGEAKRSAAAAAVTNEEEMAQIKQVKMYARFGMDAINEDANEADVPEPRKRAPVGKMASIGKMADPMDLVAGEEPKLPAAAAKKPSPKSALKLSKCTNSSTVKSTPQLANAPPAKAGASAKTPGSNSLSALPSTWTKKNPNSILAKIGGKAATELSALKNMFGPRNIPLAVSTVVKPAPKKPDEKPLSPMQTYEMSDREEDSDSESESESDYDGDIRQSKKKKKKIPEWAQKANLHRALEKQFADGPNRLDPDEIFGEVLTCNLEEIFDKNKPRYTKRTSSGNWSKDHVTLAEKLTYKRNMGYDK